MITSTTMRKLIILLGFCNLFLFSTARWVKEMENKGMYEGDMILSPDQLEAAEKGELGFASTHKNHWPKLIYYDWAPELANNRGILAAIQDYEKYTCLRFKKRTNEQDYMYFYKGKGCYSGVGYFKGGGKHSISIGSGCTGKGTVIHEIGHNLGIYHEQARPDRDDYITVHFENIRTYMGYNFNKQKASNINYYGTKYDYRSVMHYPDWAFSMNGKKTITTKDPAMQKVIGNRAGLSEIDKVQINRMYKCNEGPVTTTAKPITTPKPPVGSVLIKHFGGRCLGVASNNNLIFTDKCNTYFKQINGGQLILTGGASGCVEPKGSGNSELVVKPKCTATWSKTGMQSNGLFSIQHSQTNKCVHPQGGSAYPKEGNKVVIHSGCNQNRLRFKTVEPTVRSVLIKHFGGRCLGVDSSNNLIFTSKCNTYFREINGGQLILTGGASGCVESNGSGELVVKPKCTATWSKTGMQSNGLFSIRHNQKLKCVHPKGGSTNPNEGNKVVIHSGCNANRLRFMMV